MRFEARISDPMWGAVPMTRLESRVLQHKSLARLAQIKQMGLAFLDFPGLTHTRLEHSIGVMHVADRIFETLRQSDQPPGVRRLLARASYARRVRQAIRLAALFHDLGHPPFSHAVESTFKRYPNLLERAIEGAANNEERQLFTAYSHEAFTRWTIDKRILQTTGLAHELIEDLGAGLVSEIANLAVGKAGGDLEPFNPIISGEFDADRIDYLIRDNHRSGFVLGLSLDEIHNAVHLLRNDKGYELFIDASALPFVNAVLQARQRLIRRVHLAPSGRVATQMMINCLYHILNRYQDPKVLAATIQWLHTDCTDYTFFRRLLEESQTFDDLADSLPKYYVKRFERVTKRPQASNLWPERVNIDFMQMHPCLRLLAHTVASGNWQSPEHLTFQHRKKLYFVEPSTRPSQASDLKVDYGRNPHEGTTPGDPLPQDLRTPGIKRSLDFIGASENRLGRAILVEAMSNVDVFAYELNPTPDGVVGVLEPSVRAAKLGSIEGSSPKQYWANLKGDAKLVARSIVDLAHKARTDWPVEELGLIGTDFLLVVLYALDSDVRQAWHGARGIYVYRSEFFVNRFLPSLKTGENEERPGLGYLFPSLFRADPSRENVGKRVFSQIQRLAAFGLIVTRSNSVINRRRGAQSSGATRFGVYSTREEVRINAWGRAYVENEIEPGWVEAAIRVISKRQTPVRKQQERLSDVYMALDTPRRGDSLDALAKREDERLKVAASIHDRSACAMTFSRCECPPPPGRGKRGRRRESA